MHFHFDSYLQTMTYKEGIIKAITDLKDRTGSSLIAIKKHIQATFPAEKKWANGTFLLTLNKMVAAGQLTKDKASYKLAADFKKSLVKKSAPKKAATKPAGEAKKKAAPKKAAKPAAAAKKAVPKKKAVKPAPAAEGAAAAPATKPKKAKAPAAPKAKKVRIRIS
jgi:histone H1/5